MVRWEPDAQGRLQYAAMTLFVERGYAAVTVAEIADWADLTKRAFFNHFPDKREVLFAGAQDFEAGIVKDLAKAPMTLPSTRPSTRRPTVALSSPSTAITPESAGI